MRQLLENHELTGKRVDFDWRPAKEKDLPYDSFNKNVVQNVLVTEARQDCYGDVWLYSDNYAPQKINRVIKVYKYVSPT